jgi:preprotein translocase subunit SecD
MLRDIAQARCRAWSALASQTTGVGVTGQRDWDVNVVDATRIVMTPTDAGLKAAVDKAMGDRDRSGAQAHRRTRHARADDRARGQRPHPRPGSRPADPDGLKALLGKTAKLEFKLVDLTADPGAGRARAMRPRQPDHPAYPNNPQGGPVIAVSAA